MSVVMAYPFYLEECKIDLQANYSSHSTGEHPIFFVFLNSFPSPPSLTWFAHTAVFELVEDMSCTYLKT